MTIKLSGGWIRMHFAWYIPKWYAVRPVEHELSVHVHDSDWRMIHAWLQYLFADFRINRVRPFRMKRHFTLVLTLKQYSLTCPTCLRVHSLLVENTSRIYTLFLRRLGQSNRTVCNVVRSKLCREKMGESFSIGYFYPPETQHDDSVFAPLDSSHHSPANHTSIFAHGHLLCSYIFMQPRKSCTETQLKQTYLRLRWGWIIVRSRSRISTFGRIGFDSGIYLDEFSIWRWSWSNFVRGWFKVKDGNKFRVCSFIRIGMCVRFVIAIFGFQLMAGPRECFDLLVNQ